MSDPILIVGASVRAAAMSAARAGFSFYAADLFADLDLQRLGPAEPVRDYPRGLAAVARRWRGGPIVYTGALENHPALVDRLARSGLLYGNAGRVLRAVRDPERWSSALLEAGMRVPPWRRSLRGLPRDGTWLRKPRASSGGRGVFAVDAAMSAPRKGGPWYYQRRVAGRSGAAVFVSAAERAVLLGVTRQLIGRPWCGGRDFWYCGSVGPIALPPEAETQLRRIGDVLTARFALRGLWGVDFVQRGAAIWPVEINPRWTASVEVLERAAGFNAMRVQVAACRDGRLPRTVASTKRVGGKVILYARSDLRIAAETVRRWLRGAEASPWPAVADIPSAGTEIAAGRPIATLLAEGGDVAGVLRTLRRRAAAELAALEFAAESAAGVVRLRR